MSCTPSPDQADYQQPKITFSKKVTIVRRTLSNEQLSYKFTVENVVVDRSQFSLKKKIGTPKPVMPRQKPDFIKGGKPKKKDVHFPFK